MRHFRLIFLLAMIPVVSSAQSALPWHRDLDVVSVNKLAPHASFVSRDASGEALQTSLNGTWKFRYFDDFRDVPEDVASAPAADWNDIKVPGNWEFQGFGTAIYVNHPFEFKTWEPTPPLLPEAIPTGVYRTSFRLPEGWADRHTILHLAAAKSGVYVYLNGSIVGYSEESKDPAEFLLDPFLRAGENTLTLVITRWSTGSYLECQDFWRVSGIERDVLLLSRAPVAVADFAVRSSLSEDFSDGLLRLSAELTNSTAEPRPATLKYELLNPSGAVVLRGSSTETIPAGESLSLRFDEQTLPRALHWTAETPNLYSLHITLESPGQGPEQITQRVGFRHIAIRDGLFLVNGQPIKLKGTNIHETSLTGHYVSPAEMRRNFELMKLNNINAVRLSHYPQADLFYDLCDEYGLYVYDEANIESHGMYYKIWPTDMRRGTLGHNPDWLEHHLDRVGRMFHRNKNHPSVTIWSLGNEAGNGFNFYNAYVMLKELDADLMARPVCYERALWEWNTDMYVPQYPSAAWLRARGEEGADRPVVPSEYSHAMGNSSGDLLGQWEAIYKYPQLQGGFIWDWIDQSTLAYDAEGRPFWTYGGDFGGEYVPSDGNFVANGIVGPDQVPHPAISEVKYTHQDVGFEAVDLAAGRVRITNRFYFTSLADYTVRWEIRRNERVVRSGVLPLSLAPQSSETVTIPVDGLRAGAGEEYFLNFDVVSRRAAGLVPAGHTIAYDQFELPLKGPARPATPARIPSGTPALDISDNGNLIAISSPRVVFAFDRAAGVATSYKVDGVEYFSEGFGLRPNFWRGPTDNDYGNGAPARLHIWKTLSNDPRVESATATRDGDKVKLSVTYAWDLSEQGLGRIAYHTDYTVWPTGHVEAALRYVPMSMSQTYDLALLNATTHDGQVATFTPKTAEELEALQKVLEIPRIGVRFRAPAGMDNVSWFGRGPEENYADRFRGTRVGLYSAKAWDLYTPYVRPQENGHHTQTRWLELLDDAGLGLRMVAEGQMEFNALRNSVEDFDGQEADKPYQWLNHTPAQRANHDEAVAANRLRKQTHAADIVPRDFVEVCLDGVHQGVAGYNSWGDRPQPYATIYSDREYSWGFTLVPVTKTSVSKR